jgi:hypothetical protein
MIMMIRSTELVLIEIEVLYSAIHVTKCVMHFTLKCSLARLIYVASLVHT